ncbi:hypothetical protein [Flagellimonas sp.]|uniref:hypothetical protein n=1 Tax=Flagellimonas sp. TaxID=2058762 RepID=UPI003BB0B551
MAVKPNYELLKKASADLGLNFETQDWGIINSSSSRILDFMDYFHSCKHENQSIQYELFDLIVASFNDAIVEDKSNFKLVKTFVDFIANNHNNELFAPILDYWRGIRNQDYPVGFFW